MAFKSEDASDIDSVKKEVMQLVQAYDNGISEAELSRTMSSTSVKNRMTAINALTNEGKIQLCKRGSELIYRAVDAKFCDNHSAVVQNIQSLEERAVYLVVESAGSKGIWNREIRNQTKLPLNHMTKILKNLETKKLIKAVKSVTASKRKLYMLYNLEPDKSVTGGAWYSGTEFESEYVQILYEQCYQFVKRRLCAADDTKDFIEARKTSIVTSAEVKDHIDNLKISTVKLSLQDIEMVLETIVFDGLIEKINVTKKFDVPQTNATTVPTVKTENPITSDDDEGSESGYDFHSYRALSKLVESSGVMRSPCGLCPYVHECRPGAVISPENCLYFERWFST